MSRITRCAATIAALMTGGTAAAEPLRLASPDGVVEIVVDAGSSGAPSYQLLFDRKVVLPSSTLGLQLDRGGPLGPKLKPVASSRRSADERYPIIGKAAEGRDRYNELTIDYAEPSTATGESGRRLQIVFRAYDDGIAFRYRLPDQPGWSGSSVRSEATEFNFAADHDCHGLNLGQFHNPHEGEFDPVRVSAIRNHHLFDAPLVCRTGSASFAIAEADLDHYPGMYLTGSVFGALGVQVKLAPLPSNPEIVAQGRIGSDLKTPWRVVMVGRDAGALIESTLITNLNPPPSADFSWVKPGKTAWDWWNGYNVAAVPRAGVNDATVKAFVDFAGKQGLPYMLIDAGWYPGSSDVRPSLPGADPTRSIPAINLPELVRYAADRQVWLWLWVRWDALDPHMEEAFAWYERLGIKGVKVDFMDRDDQWMVDFYHRLLARAAAHHLMVDLHGAYHPTGLNRTYPNYLTQEGVMGAEYNKWSTRITARHNVTLPFTRMLLGPMDYTPGGFRNAAPAAFTPVQKAPQVQTTRGHALAMYVVYDSPFQGVSDSPDVYAVSPDGLDFVRDVPVTWDETRVLSGAIGEHIVMARRKGQDWWIGAMTNEQPRTLRIPLAFLGEGRFVADIRRDGTRPDAIVRSSKAVAAGDVLTVRLAGAGGAAIRIVPGQR